MSKEDRLVMLKKAWLGWKMKRIDEDHTYQPDFVSLEELNLEQYKPLNESSELFQNFA